MSGRLFLLLATLSLLAACASPTPYQPADGGYGYSEQRLESNRFRVTFAGNSSTPRDSVQNYLLFRAAELTVQEGFDYFTVADQDVERSTRYYSQGFYDDYGYPYSLRSRRYTRSYIGPRFYSSSARPVDEYTNVADILMFEGEKPAADVNAYDAKDVLERLQVTINQPAS
jgi:hypothetical protein